VTTLAALALAVGCAPIDDDRSTVNEAETAPLAAHPDTEVRNIILMIADGAGAGAWTAAKYASDNLAVQRMPVAGLVDTRSASHKVSDSAAGASVYATGQRATNRTISVGPSANCPLPRSPPAEGEAWPRGCKPLEGWFASARDKGKATGIVTTTFVVDATPAAFVAHSPSRYWHEALALQFADFGLDVLLGGGERNFAADTRLDGRDVLGEMCARSRCLARAEELDAYRADDRPLVGLFANFDFDELDPRPAGLPAMVGAALQKLDRDPDGFVAMFETEATDNATHANALLERVTADMLEFDRAVAVALDYAGRTPGTLLIVTADHETGGFSLVESGNDFELVYANRGHTAAMVPLFAAGPQSRRFGGLRENFEIGQMLMEIVRAW
jgi:alkaline phosphatase